MDKTFKQRLEILPIKNIEHPVGNTKYYAAVHVKSLIAQADEEFQELKEQHGNQAESILLMLDEIKSLKSQLQHQALPVVPWCVGKTVEILKKKPESSWSKLYEALGEEGVTWLNEFQHKDERFGFGGLNSKLFVLFHLAINSYTVEKPQLFYLKSKSLLENEGESEESDVDELYLNAKGNLVIYKGDAKKFTQSEIDSMQTESYEQIEVTE
ncbi:DUF1642 domain-containing protein [Lactococcus lactis]